MNAILNFVFSTGYYLTVVLFVGLLLLPLITKLKILKSKRDPYAWRRINDEGSPAWLTRRLIIILVSAMMAANLFTPIFYALYVEFFGIGRGTLFQMGDRITQIVGEYFYNIPNTVRIIQPLHWQQQMDIFSGAWLPVFTIFLGFGFFYLLRRYRNLENKVQAEYGGDMFTEPYEVKQQYQAVPDRGLSFEGYGGVPVSHHFKLNKEGMLLCMATIRPKKVPTEWLKYSSAMPGDPNPKQVPGEYYIDQKNVNTILLGDTRSGKGETLVLPTIDLIARGKKDQSIVVADMKGELSTKTIDLLKRHNYDVKIVNFDNLNYSMPIQLLSQAIYYAKRGNYARARTKISQLTNTIFPSDEKDFKNHFWTNGSSATFSGLTMATMWLMQRDNDWDKVTVGNVTEMLEKLGTVEETVDLNGERIHGDPQPGEKTKQLSKLDLLIDCLKLELQRKQENGEVDELLQMAIGAFNQAGVGGMETKRNIYSSMFSDVELFVSDISVRKLTTIDSFRYSSVGFPRVLELQLPAYFGSRKVSIEYDAHGKHYAELVIADEMGLVQFAIEPKLEDYTTFEIKFDDIENNIAIDGVSSTVFDKHITIQAKKRFERLTLREVKHDPFSDLPVINGYEIIELKTDIVDGEVQALIDYSEKRTAVFVILPPLNAQYNKLAMFFMEQLYQENYDWANRNKNASINRIHFLMDEFGNFPAWPGLKTKLSAALSYNFEFTIVLQNMEQLTDTYGPETAGTITANSSNYGYLKTSSSQTAEQISNRLGHRTIQYSTPGHDKTEEDSRSRTIKEQPLLSAVQLMRFRPSQMLFFRGAKNDDLSGRLVDTNPIYNYGLNAMPFAFNLLKGYIRDSPELARIQVESPQRYINLKNYAIDFYSELETLYKTTHRKTGGFRGEQSKTTGSTNSMLLNAKQLGDERLISVLSNCITDILEKIPREEINLSPTDYDACLQAAKRGEYPFAGEYGNKHFLRLLVGDVGMRKLIARLNDSRHLATHKPQTKS